MSLSFTEEPFITSIETFCYTGLPGGGQAGVIKVLILVSNRLNIGVPEYLVSPLILDFRKISIGVVKGSLMLK